MKKLASFDDTFILEKIYESKKLSDEFAMYIEECEMNYIHDILSCFSGCDYSFILYGANFLEITNSNDFLISVEKMIRLFGGTNEMEKLLETTKELRYTNLFNHKVE